MTDFKYERNEVIDIFLLPLSEEKVLN